MIDGINKSLSLATIVKFVEMNKGRFFISQCLRILSVMTIVNVDYR